MHAIRLILLIYFPRLADLQAAPAPSTSPAPAKPLPTPAGGFWQQSFFPDWFEAYLRNSTFPQSIRDANANPACAEKVAVFYAGGSAVNKWDAGQEEVDKIMANYPGCPITQINHLQALDLMRARWKDIPALDEETTKDVCFSSWTGPILGQIMFNLVKWTIKQRYSIIFSNVLTNVVRLQELYDLVKAQNYKVYRIVMTITTKLHSIADLAWTRGLKENRFVALCLIHEGFRKAPKIFRKYLDVFGPENVVIYDKTDGKKRKLFENGQVLEGKKVNETWTMFTQGAPQYSPVYMEQNMNQTILKLYQEMNLQCGTCGMSMRSVGKEFLEAKVPPPRISKAGSYLLYSDSCADGDSCGKSVKPCQDETFQNNCTALCGKCYHIPPPFKPVDLPQFMKDASGMSNKDNPKGANLPKFKIFVSYKSVHNITALRLQKLLEASGFATWMDHGDMPAGSMADGIEKGLSEAALVIIMFNKEYSESIWCKAEFHFVFGMKKTFIPMKTDDWVPKGWVNFLTGGGTTYYFLTRTVDEVDAAYPKLLKQINGALAEMGADSTLLPAAPTAAEIANTGKHKTNTKSEKKLKPGDDDGQQPAGAAGGSSGETIAVLGKVDSIVKSIMTTADSAARAMMSKAETTATALVTQASDIAKSILAGAKTKAQEYLDAAPAAAQAVPATDATTKKTPAPSKIPRPVNS